MMHYDPCTTTELRSLFGVDNEPRFKLTPVSVELKPKMPEPKRIVTTGNKTIVQWMDDTKTEVVYSVEAGNAQSDYNAFCAALAKKIYGTNSAVHRVIEQHKQEYLDAMKAKAKAEKEAAKKKALDKIREQRVQAQIEKLKIYEEACDKLYHSEARECQCGNCENEYGCGHAKESDC